MTHVLGYTKQFVLEVWVDYIQTTDLIVSTTLGNKWKSTPTLVVDVSHLYSVTPVT